MTWTITPEPTDSPAAVALWRAYYTEVSDRWYLLHQGRTTDPAELEREIAADTGKDLTLLLLAHHDGTPAGTAGIRLTPDPTTAELTRVFLLPRLRGRGGAARLVTAAEQAARTLGATRMVLDTRADLTEARALYTRLGYEETPPHNTAPYADHWFTKHLT
ncbi:GNAT family N-acetyltransferase [Streptomyces sp. NPDC086077]|uniref:GNAT family N-acetyltransferase n=1 Tax=Streptomyces sp. NPDC086077 TaxID=3154862 RepID=UPI003429C735